MTNKTKFAIASVGFAAVVVVLIKRHGKKVKVVKSDSNGVTLLEHDGTETLKTPKEYELVKQELEIERRMAKLKEELEKYKEDQQGQ